jgi:elongation factor G
MTGPSPVPGPPPDRSRWRNIGIVAHINAGKTTLTERILFDTGRQRHCGDVDSGTATTDWQREEQERGISIEAAVTDVHWRGYRIQLVDTPGHVDFAAEVERVLRVLDGAVVVVDGVRGVEPQTEAVWQLLDRVAVPRLIFVNKLDRSSADFGRVLRSIDDQLGARPVPLVMPVRGTDGGLAGLVDAVGGRRAVWAEVAPVGPEFDDLIARTVDCCGDLDDELLATFVSEGGVDEAEIHAALRRIARSRAAVPVFAGSALNNRGIEPLLDGICRYLPSPLDRLATLLPDQRPGEEEAALAFVFKTAVGPQRVLALARVFRGQIRPGMPLETGEAAPLRLRGLWKVHADDFTPLESAGPGAIVALSTDLLLRTGETLRAPSTAVRLEPIRFSEPVLASRVEPRAAADAAALIEAARELAVGDPTLRVEIDETSGALLVAGMGELHLDVFRDRLQRTFGETVHFGAPGVLCYETVAGPGVGTADCERAVGAARIRAHARVLVEPAPGQGVRFRWAVPGDVADVVRDELLTELSGLAAGGFHAAVPARDIALEVVEASSDGPAQMARPLLAEAVGLAVRRAVEDAGPVRLEPTARLLVSVPHESLGSVLAELRSRGARIEEVLPGAEVTEVRGTVLLRRMLGYATPLRSMSRGRGTFELVPAGLEPADEGAG